MLDSSGAMDQKVDNCYEAMAAYRRGKQDGLSRLRRAWLKYRDWLFPLFLLGLVVWVVSGCAVEQWEGEYVVSKQSCTYDGGDPYVWKQCEEPPNKYIDVPVTAFSETGCQKKILAAKYAASKEGRHVINSPYAGRNCRLIWFIRMGKK